MQRLVCITAALLFIGALGCTQSYGVRIDAEKIAAIKKGETTKAQVVSLLGQPSQKSMLDGKEFYQYHYMSVRHNMGFGRASSENQSATISFDEKGIVETVSSSSGGF